MSHQPPVPEAATSPYPTRQAPFSDDAQLAADDALDAEADSVDWDDDDADEGDSMPHIDRATRMLGLGVAIGIGAAAALGAIFYARQPAETPKRRRKSGKRAKAKRGKR